MGKRPPAAKRLQDNARAASERLTGGARPAGKPLDSRREAGPSTSGGAGRAAAMEGGGADQRMPLSEVVADCVRRWFQDALKEARGGDVSMQVLVGQMYQSGYGIARNEQKAKAWIAKASRYRSSVWRVSEKRPGYNASDSDSEEEKDDTRQS